MRFCAWILSQGVKDEPIRVVNLVAHISVQGIHLLTYSSPSLLPIKWNPLKKIHKTMLNK